MKNIQKYNRYEPFTLNDRTWPGKKIDVAPIWGSVDLRDGNQALPIPMTIEKKMVMFRHLVDLGFKEIEVGFPFASETDFNFVRKLIEEKHIPEDVRIIVLSSCSKECINNSFEALKDAKKAGIQIYTLCSPAQREYVIRMTREELLDYTYQAALYTRQCTEKYSQTDFVLAYGVESFSITEIDFSLEICNEVIDAFNPTEERKCLITLPATVEVSLPNQFADQIEFMHRNLIKRDRVILGVHTHNDRGTGVAAAEQALLAGADRIEGTLFGNGERTGNMDIVTLALNLYTTGVDPKLDFSNIDESVSIYKYCTGLDVYLRHPYAGKQVFTAYSGGHQDAIRKGLLHRKEKNEVKWLVPYIPIDPRDLGRNLDNIIQINAQSGKGGIMYIVEEALDITLPILIQKEFGKHIKKISDKNSSLLTTDEILKLFLNRYNSANQLNSELSLVINEDQGKNSVLINLGFENFYFELQPLQLINDIFEQIKSKLMIESLNINELVEQQDKDGRFYSFIQISDRDKTYHAFSWGDSLFRSNIQSIILCFQSLLISKKFVGA
ncbi:2-isopropylmalate synthase [Listeria welshimeri]|uniref:2-isopropylmalate synthase n=1 Tax=Listeria welshimeri TaxID=1643 RepID=UPI001887303F|nr:2-isopropylmalate synthase [Listeria welshimeri]MBF2464326.1 2-isopropylmalate synthase [Listeria welshimeri]